MVVAQVPQIVERCILFPSPDAHTHLPFTVRTVLLVGSFATLSRLNYGAKMKIVDDRWQQSTTTTKATQPSYGKSFHKFSNLIKYNIPFFLSETA